MNRVSTKVRVPDLALMKERGERIVMLTAYDATMARLLDRAGVDLLLVGDSLGNVISGIGHNDPRIPGCTSFTTLAPCTQARVARWSSLICRF